MTKALGSLEGIEEVQVDLAKGEASFRENKPQDMSVIKEAIKRAGYEVL
ncbi:MAG: heavy metal-associated domain-containing protein [Smithellaceae bacterium]|nr:heavy metal-associated domain-containing protein [Smithellaceae bacterium]